MIFFDLSCHFEFGSYIGRIGHRRVGHVMVAGWSSPEMNAENLFFLAPCKAWAFRSILFEFRRPTNHDGAGPMIRMLLMSVSFWHSLYNLFLELSAFWPWALDESSNRRLDIMRAMGSPRVTLELEKPLSVRLNTFANVPVNTDDLW